MDIKDIESVLLLFYENRTSYQYFKDIKQYLRESLLTDIEIQAIIQKLVKDGYIIEEEQLQAIKSGKDMTIKEQGKVWGWFISYDGIFLIDTLPTEYAKQPYAFLINVEKKKKRATAIENVPKKYWWLYNPISFILPLLIGYYVGGSKSNQPNKINQIKNEVVQPISKTQDTSKSLFQRSIIRKTGTTYLNNEKSPCNLQF